MKGVPDRLSKRPAGVTRPLRITEELVANAGEGAGFGMGRANQSVHLERGSGSPSISQSSSETKRSRETSPAAEGLAVTDSPRDNSLSDLGDRQPCTIGLWPVG